MLVLLLLLSVATVAAAWKLSCALAAECERSELVRRFLPWCVKAVLAPLVIWALMNVGLSWKLHPFMPQVKAAQNAGTGWFMAYLSVMATGLLVITSYWSAVTLVWALIEAGASAEEQHRTQLKALCRGCSMLMAAPALALLYFGGWTMLGLAGIILLGPMAVYGATILHTPPTPPAYARAVGRMKLGKYSEAEWEIIRQLEKHQDDFDGWMMLAELYANQFNDLPGAERTILEICNQPTTTPSQLAVALHRLADWQLQRAGDPVAARHTLQMICDRLPTSHLAHMAQLRMHQLPASAAALRQQQSGDRIPLPALGDSIEQVPAPVESENELHQAAQTANECVELLKEDPRNVPARERLARLFAERLDEPDRGIQQVTLLLDLPDQPEARRAEWLGMIAAWHIKYRHDLDAGRQTLERIVRDFPQSPQAFAARWRLNRTGGIESGI
ncbi:MAG TPA: hypothetical protein PKI20_02270 [Verrucomicrobiota bacterium]|nr:hypothetical protein [Verrucomicrobiota bacterium]HQL78406.1 hypothetical protein [Verrucomicrobiota bacterium]